MPQTGKVSNKKLMHKQCKSYGWDEAIEDVKHELLRNRVRREELEAAMKVFAARKDSGEPWPGEIAV